MSSSRNWAELTGEVVLQLLNDHSGLTLPELHKCLRDLYGSYVGHPMVTWNLLYTLVKLDLIVAENLTKEEAENYLEESLYKPHLRTPAQEVPKFRVTPSYVMARNGMELRPVGPPRVQSEFSTLLFPTFGPPSTTPRADLFALMEFNDRSTALYEDHIKKIARKLELSVLRADEMLTNRVVIHDIWTGIYGSAGVIAECTGRNPNVFYEVGIAHTLGKPALLLLEVGSEMPFDLRHIRYLEYDFTPRGVKEFERKLFFAIAELLGMDDNFYWEDTLKGRLEGLE